MKKSKSVCSSRKHKGIGYQADDLGLNDLAAPQLDTLFNRVEQNLNATPPATGGGVP